jgi:hypothetical protein
VAAVPSGLSLTPLRIKKKNKKNKKKKSHDIHESGQITLGSGFKRNADQLCPGH